MFKVVQTANPEKVKEFNTQDEALAFVKKQRKAKSFYNIIEEKEIKEKKQKKSSVKELLAAIDFTGAVEITRENVKHFYNKSGYIKVVNASGNVLHIGKTKNMGKVFSNYVNCARYNQSYDFDLDGSDRLLFAESEI